MIMGEKKKFLFIFQMLVSIRKSSGQIIIIIDQFLNQTEQNHPDKNKVKSTKRKEIKSNNINCQVKNGKKFLGCNLNPRV